MKHDRLSRRLFLQTSASLAVLGVGSAFGCGRDLPRAPLDLATVSARLRSPQLGRIPSQATLSFGGALGERLTAMQHNWLIRLPSANPWLTEVYRSPDQNPDGLPWQGELAGKYLIGAVQMLRMTHDPLLDEVVRSTADKLVRYQGPDGYLGAFRRAQRFTLWDAWGHYHCMLGLLEVAHYYADRAPHRAWSGQVRATVLRAADLMYHQFVEGRRSVGDADPNARAQNEAVAHVFALLLDDPELDADARARYRAMCAQIARDWRDVQRSSGHYFTDAALWRSNQPRWESLPDIQALAELAYDDDQPGAADAFRRLWSSIHGGNTPDGTGDVHNHGGFSSSEQASGNPYDPRPSETCATVAWMALCIDKLRLDGTRDTLAADALELSTYNAVLGFQTPDATQFSYDTSMGGIPVADQGPMSLMLPMSHPPRFAAERRPTRHDLYWQQSGENTHDLSCCSANGPRGLGCLSEWAVMLADDLVAINFYGPSRFELPIGDGNLTIVQETDYPYGSGRIVLTIHTDTPLARGLALRIPAWAEGARLTRRGASVMVVPGSYAVLDGPIQDELLVLELPLTVRTVRGRRSPNGVRGSAEGKTSLYRGPLLLAYDERLDAWSASPGGPSPLPTIDAARNAQPVTPAEVAVQLALRFASARGDTSVTLCDFASAGNAPSARMGEDVLTSRSWQLARLPDPGSREPLALSPALRFRSGGGIAGTRGAIDGGSERERHWSLDRAGQLILHAADGRITTRFPWGTITNGRRILRGPSEDPSNILELAELEPNVVSKTFQLRRRESGALLGLLTFDAGGALRGAGAPSNAGWTVDAQGLALLDPTGRVSTRFTDASTARGRMLYVGRTSAVPGATYELIECSPHITNKIFRFSRADGSEIARRVRFIERQDGRIIEGLPYGNQNEDSWQIDAEGKLSLFGRDGNLTTRFDVVGATPEGMVYQGTFRPDPRITHVLTEIDLNWSPGRRVGMGVEQWITGASYISWLDVV